jgi:hypothetical protein
MPGQSWWETRVRQLAASGRRPPESVGEMGQIRRAVGPGKKPSDRTRSGSERAKPRPGRPGSVDGKVGRRGRAPGAAIDTGRPGNDPLRARGRATSDPKGGDGDRDSPAHGELPSSPSRRHGRAGPGPALWPGYRTGPTTTDSIARLCPDRAPTAIPGLDLRKGHVG